MSLNSLNVEVTILIRGLNVGSYCMYDAVIAKHCVLDCKHSWRSMREGAITYGIVDTPLLRHLMGPVKT